VARLKPLKSLVGRKAARDVRRNCTTRKSFLFERGATKIAQTRRGKKFGGGRSIFRKQSSTPSQKEPMEGRETRRITRGEGGSVFNESGRVSHLARAELGAKKRSKGTG